jgi:hypothetical protein
MQTGVLGHNSIKLFIVVLAAISSAVSTSAQLGEAGQLNSVTGFQNFYDAAYNSDILGEPLRRANANRINFAAINTPFGLLPAGVDVDLNLHTLLPAVIWISPYTILGAEYGSYLGAFLANNRQPGDLFSGTSGVRNSRFGLGELYAQGVWLDWAKEHWDFSLSYDFQTPSAFPYETDAPTELKNNVGLGYSAQHARAGVAWYPMTNKATAVTFAWTYQYNGGNEYFDVRPGQMFTVSWSVNHYVPLRKNRELLLEAGPAGYDTCQITDSTGGNALADAPKSHIQALGGELGLTYIPWNAFVTVRSFYEYAARSHFQGASIGLNFGIKF